MSRIENSNFVMFLFFSKTVIFFQVFEKNHFQRHKYIFIPYKKHFTMKRCEKLSLYIYCLFPMSRYFDTLKKSLYHIYELSWVTSFYFDWPQILRPPCTTYIYLRVDNIFLYTSGIQVDTISAKISVCLIEMSAL